MDEIKLPYKSNNGLTIGELRKIIDNIPTYCNDKEVWISNAPLLSSCAFEVWALNKSEDGFDLLIKSTVDNE